MNPVLLNLGVIEIKWYSFLIFVSFIISIIFISKEAKKYNIPKDFIINLLFWVVIMGIIGARLYFVIFNLEYYLNSPNEIIKIWEGGLAIHGGIILGTITGVIYCKKYKVKILRICDIIFPWLLLTQAIGRWGNFFNSEAYGPSTTLEKLQSLHLPDFIINGMHINGVYYTPTFLYESVWCLIGFILVLIIRKLKYTKIGTTTAIYFMWYSVGRFVIESLRLDSLMLGNIKIAQLVSVLLFITGIIILSLQSRKPKLDELYNDLTDKENIEF